jgi:streptogramin lyase
MKSIIVVLAGLALLLPLSAMAQFNNPNGIVFDGKGNLWLANAGDNNVLELNPANGTVLNTITSGVNGPTRLFFDSSDNLWVNDTGNNTITVYEDLSTQGAKLLRTISSGLFSRSLSFALDAYGDLYVGNTGAGTNNVLAFNINGRKVETLTKDDSNFEFFAPGAMVIHGRNIYIGFGPNFGTNAVISYNVGEFLTSNPEEITVYNDKVDTGPTGITFDAEGNVYISEYTTPSWVKYSASGELLLAVKDGVNGPEGIALDASGNVYVSNADSNNITVYNPSGTLIRTIQ